jgi:hypothetical protein
MTMVILTGHLYRVVYQEVPLPQQDRNLAILAGLDELKPVPTLEVRVRVSHLLSVTAVLSASFLIAQTQAPTQPPQPPDWVPQAIADLEQTASSHSDFSFDHSMLVLASKIDQDDDSLRRVIAGVEGVSVHRLRFQNGAGYDSAILENARQQANAAGWEHLGGGHKKGDFPAGNDVWFRFENNAIRKVAFMTIGPDHINFVTISGSISPLDLLHLAGHFGIPPIEGGARIPNSGASRPTSPQPGY